MRGRVALWRLSTLAALLLVAITIMYPMLSTAEAEKAATVQIPKPPFKAGYAKGLILYPRLSTPAFVEPGGTFIVKFSKKIAVSKIVLDDGFGHVYNFTVNKEVSAVKLTLPSDVHYGLYDLIVITVDGKAFGEPKAVYVAKPGLLKTIYIVHVTDRHFGVINGNGRSAANYDLAAAMIALGLPNNTIVIDTGDIADNAAAPEYEESLYVDMLLNKPMLAIPGNHDHVGGSKLYGVFRGYYNYTLSIYNLYRVVAIDSGSEGYITTDQAIWAANVLKSAREPVTIVLFHHPHFTHIYGDNPIVFNVESAEKLYELLLSKKPNSKYPYIYTSWLSNKEALKTLVEGIYECPSKLVLVLSGHIHMDSYAKVIRKDGSVIQYIVTTATGGSVRTYRNDYHGFRIIKLSAGGNYTILGDGEPWNLHASFNLENTSVAIVENSNAVAALFSLGDPHVAKLLTKTVVALPIPDSFYGKTVKVYMKGLNKLVFRCTPLGCIAYGIADEKPVAGETYILALYTKPDEKPPTIEIVSIQPKTPVIGRPVTIKFKVSDDSWGVAQVTALVSYGNKTLTFMPAKFGSTYRLVLPKLTAEKAVVKIVAVDASGKETEKTIEITYSKPQTTTTTKPTTTTTTPTATATHTTTTQAQTVTTTEKTAVTAAETGATAQLPTTTTTVQSPPSPTAAPSKTSVPLSSIVVVSIALIVGVALAIIALRRAG